MARAPLWYYHKYHGEWSWITGALGQVKSEGEDFIAAEIYRYTYVLMRRLWHH